jgi:hypothetical protein
VRRYLLRKSEQIPLCYWDGTDEKRLAEAAYSSAVHRPLAGAVRLQAPHSCTRRTPEEWDGGVTRIPDVQWEAEGSNAKWVYASALWALANQKPGTARQSVPISQQSTLKSSWKSEQRNVIEREL